MIRFQCFTPLLLKFHMDHHVLMVESIWRFPEVGVPPNHPFFVGMFHEINQYLLPFKPRNRRHVSPQSPCCRPNSQQCRAILARALEMSGDKPYRGVHKRCVCWFTIPMNYRYSSV